MSRYIDAENLKNAKCLIADNPYAEGWNDAIDAIVECEPTADVVEVVRCKDCRHGKMKNYAPPQAPWCCIISTQCHKGDFFCACGERRQ